MPPERKTPKGTSAANLFSTAFVVRSNILLLMAGIVLFSIASQLFYSLMTVELVIIGFLASPIYILTTFIGSKFYNSRGKRVFKRIALLLLALIAISTFIASFN